MEYEEQKEINDIEEDRREEAESIKDAEEEVNTSEEKKAVNDIAEDNREEGESIEDLKESLKTALYENAILKQQLETATRERDEAHNAFLNNGRTSEVDKRDYAKLVGDLK